MKYYIGIDLGGTNIAAGLVDENYNIVSRASVPTKVPCEHEALCDDMIKAAKTAVENADLTLDDVEWIGVGTPGTANPKTGILEYANNLYVRDMPMRAIIKRKIGKDVYIENDANAAAYGEAIAGAAKGKKDVLAITLGTGLGGGIIIDGKIYGGHYYAGAELGHMGIVFGGRQCTCGRKGCIEAYASATGLINITKDYMMKDKSSKLWELCKGDAANLNGKIPFDAMRLGDETARKAVEEYIEYLAYGVTNFINIFQPETLLIGGGICKEGELLLKPIREYVTKYGYSKDPEHNTEIQVASLGNDAGIIGAAFLGNQTNS